MECDIPGAFDLRVELPTAILAPQWLYSTHPQPPPMASLPPDASFRPPWQPDQDAPQCNGCPVQFSLFKRRHHCRSCVTLVSFFDCQGKVFCKNCANQKYRLDTLGYDEPVLVCVGCVDVASRGGELYQEAPQLPAGPSEEYGQVPSAPPIEAQEVPT